MDAVAQLVALGREELALAQAGELDALGPLAERRAAVLAALPHPLPPAAVPHVEEALALQRAVEQLLLERATAVRSELAGLSRTRAGAQGYVPAGTAARPVLDLQG